MSPCEWAERTMSQNGMRNSGEDLFSDISIISTFSYQYFWSIMANIVYNMKFEANEKAKG